ncbi:hypothetical protein MTO96_003375 [Rhipicephalus appendiculatus]
MWKRGKLAFLLLLIQVSLIIVYALCVQYEVAADASNGLNSMSEALGGNAPKDNSIEKYYSSECAPSPRLLSAALARTARSLIERRHFVGFLVGHSCCRVGA